MIRTFFQGDIYIQVWEFILIPLYLVLIMLISTRIKNVRIKTQPEYKYYLWGLYTKILGGIGFALVYIYYYKGGDTMAYYETARAMANMFMEDPGTYVKVLFGPNTMENFLLFNTHTGMLVNYIYFDNRTFMVCRCISPLLILGFKSYLLTTILVAWLTYSGLWRLYQMFVRHYPQLIGMLALTVLFIPSTVFWGSGILKDSFTMAATGYYAYMIDQVGVQRKFRLGNILVLVLSAYFLIALKPYIFVVLFPGALYWVFNDRLKRIRNKLIKYVVIPFAYVIFIGGSIFTLNALGDRLDKFSMQKAFETASVTQRDLRQDYYGGNSFDIGEFEPTWAGALSKFVPATTAGLLRPFLWEAKNVVMVASGLENLFLLFLVIWAVWRARVVYFIPAILREPLVLFSVLFTITFGFFIGLSTANFGALVRFKIPLLPFFASSMAILIKTYRTPNRRRLIADQEMRMAYAKGRPLRRPQRMAS